MKHVFSQPLGSLTKSWGLEVEDPDHTRGKLDKLVKIILFDLHFLCGLHDFFFGGHQKHQIHHLEKNRIAIPKNKKKNGPKNKTPQERGHSASITAKSTTVIWRLHRSALHLPVTLARLENDTPKIPIPLEATVEGCRYGCFRK